MHARNQQWMTQVAWIALGVVMTLGWIAPVAITVRAKDHIIVQPTGQLSALVPKLIAWHHTGADADRGVALALDVAQSWATYRLLQHYGVVALIATPLIGAVSLDCEPTWTMRESWPDALAHLGHAGRAKLGADS